MSDVVKTLRHLAEFHFAVEQGDYCLKEALINAANEIERLMQAADEIERLERQLFVDVKAEEENIKLHDEITFLNREIGRLRLELRTREGQVEGLRESISYLRANLD